MPSPSISRIVCRIMMNTSRFFRASACAPPVFPVKTDLDVRRPVRQRADPNVQRAGGGQINCTADPERQYRFSKLRLNLRAARANGEKAGRHAQKHRRCQQRKAPFDKCAAEIRFAKKQPAAAGTRRSRTQTQIAYVHQQCAQCAEQTIAPIGFRKNQRLFALLCWLITSN